MELSSFKRMAPCPTLRAIRDRVLQSPVDKLLVARVRWKSRDGPRNTAIEPQGYLEAEAGSLMWGLKVHTRRTSDRCADGV
jgi:hypothetical protein